jgi:hypothetical protein
MFLSDLMLFDVLPHCFSSEPSVQSVLTSHLDVSGIQRWLSHCHSPFSQTGQSTTSMHNNTILINDKYTKYSIGGMLFYLRIECILFVLLACKSVDRSTFCMKRAIYIYVWILNQTVLELDFRAVKFLFFPRRDLNPHHWYTAALFA